MVPVGKQGSHRRGLVKFPYIPAFRVEIIVGKMEMDDGV